MNNKKDLDDLSLAEYAQRVRDQLFGNYTPPKKQHVLVNKWGTEIMRANSFWGLIGNMFVALLIGFVSLMIFVGIICGISSLFE